VDLALTPAQQELQARAATFVDEELIPLEVEAELAHGRLPKGRIDRVRARARELRLVGGNHPRDLGGQGWTAMEAVLVHEELGRSTNAIWWAVEGGYNVLGLGTPAQIDRYLRPVLRGERQDAYAVTEADAGSDPSRIATTAERVPEGFRLRGEKWFVTSGDVADFYIVMANAPAADGRPGPTLFLVDADTPGIETVDDPPFAHNYPHGHPTLRFDCVLPEDAVLGGPELVGRGDEGQNAWFVEERLHIAARCVGAMRRLLVDTVEWARNRRQFGERILDFQGISFPLADSATECTAARLLTYLAAQSEDDHADPKLVHARASMAKLHASEAAWRCADRCVQTFGGRGYMRTNVAERFLRELRVDRIWEGTSEIQRLIIARALERRGVERVLATDTHDQGPTLR
jgi:acyl-CoA dehydrogenase